MAIHGRDEAIAAAGQRLHIPGRLGRVTQGRPQPFDCGVETVLKVYKSVGGPKLLLQLFPRDYFARPRQQYGKNFYRLAVKLYLCPVFPEFPGLSIELESSEPNVAPRFIGSRHAIPEQNRTEKDFSTRRGHLAVAVSAIVTGSCRIIYMSPR